VGWGENRRAEVSGQKSFSVTDSQEVTVKVWQGCPALLELPPQLKASFIQCPKGLTKKVLHKAQEEISEIHREKICILQSGWIEGSCWMSAAGWRKFESGHLGEIMMEKAA
jgi:hypothetical protein